MVVFCDSNTTLVKTVLHCTELGCRNIKMALRKVSFNNFLTYKFTKMCCKLPQPSSVQCKTVLLWWYYYRKVPLPLPPPTRVSHHFKHSSPCKTKPNHSKQNTAIQYYIVQHFNPSQYHLVQTPLLIVWCIFLLPLLQTSLD